MREIQMKHSFKAVETEDEQLSGGDRSQDGGHAHTYATDKAHTYATIKLSPAPVVSLIAKMRMLRLSLSLDQSVSAVAILVAALHYS